MGYKEKKPTADKIYATMKDFLPEGESRTTVSPGNTYNKHGIRKKDLSALKGGNTELTIFVYVIRYYRQS